MGDFYFATLLLSAGLCLGLAAHSAYIGFYVGRRRGNLKLALTALLMAAYFIGLNLYFRELRPEPALLIIRAVCVFLPMVTVLFGELTRVIVTRVPRWFNAFQLANVALTVLFIAAHALDITTGTQLASTGIDVDLATKHRHLILFTPAGNGYLTWINIAFYTFAGLIWLEFRQHRELWPVLGGCVTYFLTVSNDLGVLLKLYDFYFIQHFGFAILILGTWTLFSRRYHDDMELLAQTSRNLEEKNAELEEGRRWFATTLTSIADGVATTDNQGRVTFLNPAAERLTGWEHDRALGRPLAEVLLARSDSRGETAAELIERVKNQGRLSTAAEGWTLRQSGGDKTVRDIDSHGAVIASHAGDPAGIVLVFRDTTEEKRREESARHNQKLETLGTLAAGVAHEINSPLFGLITAGDAIRSEVAMLGNKDLEELSSIVVREGERISVIVRDLLTFARRDDKPLVPTDLTEIVRSTLSLLSTSLRRSGIQLTVDVADNLAPIPCRGDQIRQVLINLTGNARDAVNERHGPGFHAEKRVTISVRNANNTDVLPEGAQNPADWLTISVTDTGQGMTPETLRTIGSPFHTTKPRESGTGLGVFVSRGIVEEHGGVLHYESSPGKGTAAAFCLPRESVAAKVKTKAP